MTDSIKQWQRPLHVKAIQTTDSLAQHHSFDIHPNQANPDSIDQLIEEFDLPHVPSFLRQEHGNQVIQYIKQPTVQFDQRADACFTRSKDVICAVMTADCLPVLLTDEAGSFVAAVHCGWRSLYANILPKTLKKIGSNHQVLAWFGPCIQQPQYEVDESFVHNYLKQHPSSHEAFTAVKSGKSQANLYTMASKQLNEHDVQNITTANQCTFTNPEFYSWRQNKTHKRMASMLWLASKPQS